MMWLRQLYGLLLSIEAWHKMKNSNNLFYRLLLIIVKTFRWKKKLSYFLMGDYKKKFLKKWKFILKKFFCWNLLRMCSVEHKWASAQFICSIVLSDISIVLSKLSMIWVYINGFSELSIVREHVTDFYYFYSYKLFYQELGTGYFITKNFFR